MDNTGSSHSVHQWSFVQINLRHCRAATANLVAFMQQENIDIAFIQEPYVYNGAIKGFPLSFRIVTSSHTDAVPLAAIAIRNRFVEVFSLTQISTSSTAVCIISGCAFPSVTCISAYLSPSGNIDADVTRLSSILSQTQHSKLIAIDSNAKSPLWGPDQKTKHLLTHLK
jgi:hypothetical protein